MVKIAFFVEGQTERIFIEKLLDNFYTHPYFNVESFEIRGGMAKQITKANYEDENLNYTFLIFDVGGDGSVAGALFERADKLISKDGYSHIFGLRDLYPQSRDKFEEINLAFKNIFDGNNIIEQISLIIAIMEVEAWFLADYTFFQKIHESLTVGNINSVLNIDIENDDIESYRHPARTIDSVYQIVGRRYKKRKSDSHSICSHIDYSELCINEEKRNKIPSFNSFLIQLELL